MLAADLQGVAVMAGVGDTDVEPAARRPAVTVAMVVGVHRTGGFGGVANI
jgi:hypothetical protein